MPVARATVAKYVRKLNDELGIPHFTSHDLRRTAATHMSRLGVHDTVIAKVLNHIRQGVTWRYVQHDFMQEKGRALELWAEELAQIAAGATARRHG